MSCQEANKRRREKESPRDPDRLCVCVCVCVFVSVCARVSVSLSLSVLSPAVKGEMIRQLLSTLSPPPSSAPSFLSRLSQHTGAY